MCYWRLWLVVVTHLYSITMHSVWFLQLLVIKENYKCSTSESIKVRYFEIKKISGEGLWGCPLSPGAVSKSFPCGEGTPSPLRNPAYAIDHVGSIHQVYSSQVIEKHTLLRKYTCRQPVSISHYLVYYSPGILYWFCNKLTLNSTLNSCWTTLAAAITA